MARRILVTGAGGIGGVNFVRALRLAEKFSGDELFIVGTDYNIYHLKFPDLNVSVQSPRHSSPKFIELLAKLVQDYKIEFVHPHPSVEAKAVSENRRLFEGIGAKIFLPRSESISPDKLKTYQKMVEKGVPTPKTYNINSLEEIDTAFKELEPPLWIRARKGAGGFLSLKVGSPQEAKLWIQLNTIQGRAMVKDFIIQEYLPGRDLAFDSLWFRGRLISSYVRERLEYPFKHITLTGITGTPTIARTISDSGISRIGADAVKALDPKPEGFYSVDLREDDGGRPRVTEVDGKWHTTAPLWSFAFSKVFKEATYNFVYTYLKLGYGEKITSKLLEIDLFPEGHYLLRQLDGGVLLTNDQGKVWRIV